MAKTIHVSAGLLTRSSRLFICQRRANDQHASKWEFPGGKVENGEDAIACLQRELEEELGIQASVGEVLHQTVHPYPNGPSVALTFFHVPSYQGTLINKIFETVAWVKPSELLHYDFLEGDVAFVTQLAHGQWSHIFSS